ncbi:MAG: hypothetical protein MK237_10255 [Gemmatimonadetes bacterium]|nr:hypothetical protein [Gemmatimonadota bacterium]
MNGAGIRLGGSSCAEIKFGMHVITRPKQIKLLRLVIRLRDPLGTGAIAFFNLGITNSGDALVVDDR